jgi:hypothetical protein
VFKWVTWYLRSKPDPDDPTSWRRFGDRGAAGRLILISHRWGVWGVCGEQRIGGGEGGGAVVGNSSASKEDKLAWGPFVCLTLSPVSKKRENKNSKMGVRILHVGVSAWLLMHAGVILWLHGCLRVVRGLYEY